MLHRGVIFTSVVLGEHYLNDQCVETHFFFIVEMDLRLLLCLRRLLTTQLIFIIFDSNHSDSCHFDLFLKQLLQCERLHWVITSQIRPCFPLIPQIFFKFSIVVKLGDFYFCRSSGFRDMAI